MYDLKYDFKQFNDVMSVYMDVLVQKSTAKLPVSFIVFIHIARQVAFAVDPECQSI